MRSKIIQQIETELNKAKSADGEMFARHMYAVETLARLAAESTTGAPDSVESTQHTSVSDLSQSSITAAELKMMGAKIPAKENKAITDDGFGNGDSLFDF